MRHQSNQMANPKRTAAAADIDGLFRALRYVSLHQSVYDFFYDFVAEKKNEGAYH